MLEFSELRAFNAVAKHLNFSKAANEVGLSAPQFSKVIASLESKVKTKLLLRTTRSVRLTEEGKAFLASSVKAINSLQQTQQLFEPSMAPHEVIGSIKITAPNTLGTRFLAKPLAQFHQKFPQVQVQVFLDDHYLDFVRDEIDVALRVMIPKDSDFIAKKVSSNPISFYASPDYLKKHSRITSINDLKRHPIYCITPHFSLMLSKQKKSLGELILKTPVICTNGDLLVEIACQGKGVVVRSDWSVEREIKGGRLVKIDLDDEIISESGIYVVYPKNRYTPYRVKAFINTLIKNTL